MAYVVGFDLVLGLLLPVAGVWSAVCLLSSANRPLYRRRWLILTIGIGIGMGILANGATYMLDPQTKAFGFPLIYVIFQQGQEDGLWRDFVGWHTPVFWVGDFLNGLALPHLFLALLVLRKKRSLKPNPQ